MKPSESIAKIMQSVKGRSSKWINDNNLTVVRFQWQNGYAVFSVDRSRRHSLYRYIANQEQHHAVKKFKEEYTSLLIDADIDYNPRYYFDELF